MEEKKYYQVFSVDVCTDSYAMEHILMGAETIDALVEYLESHLTDIGYDEYTRYRVIEEKELRIRALEDTYTTEPYTIIVNYSYYE